jgi:hypothetical protein
MDRGTHLVAKPTMAFVESTHTQEGFAEHVVLLTRNWHAPVAQVPLYQMQSPEATGHDSCDVASEQEMLAHAFDRRLDAAGRITPF